MPVIVDAASMLPPRENLSKYHKLGADLVIHSGGKGIRGPQGTGILSGKKELIQAAYANASPHQFLGRSAKVAKEEIVGLLTALNNFVNEDEKVENSKFRNKSQKVVDAFSETPGLDAAVKHDNVDYLTPVSTLFFNDVIKFYSLYFPSIIQQLLPLGPNVLIKILFNWALRDLFGT